MTAILTRLSVRAGVPHSPGDFGAIDAEVIEGAGLPDRGSGKRESRRSASARDTDSGAAPAVGRQLRLEYLTSGTEVEGASAWPSWAETQVMAVAFRSARRRCPSAALLPAASGARTSCWGHSPAGVVWGPIRTALRVTARVGCSGAGTACQRPHGTSRWSVLRFERLSVAAERGRGGGVTGVVVNDDLVAAPCLGLEQRGVGAAEDGRKLFIGFCLDEAEADGELR